MELEEVVAVVSVTIVGELVIWLGIVIKATVVEAAAVVVLGLGDTAEAVVGVDIMVAVAEEEGVIIVEKKDILRGTALTLKILLHVACPDWLIGHIEFFFFVGFVIFFCWVLGDYCWEWNAKRACFCHQIISGCWVFAG